MLTRRFDPVPREEVSDGEISREMESSEEGSEVIIEDHEGEDDENDGEDTDVDECAKVSPLQALKKSFHQNKKALAGGAPRKTSGGKKVMKAAVLKASITAKMKAGSSIAYRMHMPMWQKMYVKFCFLRYSSHVARPDLGMRSRKMLLYVDRWQAPLTRLVGVIHIAILVVANPNRAWLRRSRTPMTVSRSGLLVLKLQASRSPAHIYASLHI